MYQSVFPLESESVFWLEYLLESQMASQLVYQSAYRLQFPLKSLLVSP